MKNPECMEKLYNELKEAFPDRNKMLTYADVKDLPYLDSVLHESLRISPSTSAGSEREIPKGGAMIGGYYIPEGVSYTHG
jgi:cytochrome P450